MKLVTLCDFNGVIVDDERVHFACMARVVAPLGVTLHEHDYFTTYFALDDEGAFRAILRDANLPHDDERVNALVEAKRPLYLREAESNLRFFDGASDLIVALANAGPFAIVSGALRPEIELALDKLSLRDRVELIVSAEDTTACKPDPDGYLRALDALTRKHGPEVRARAVVIEDSPGGTRAGRAAGLPVAAVLHSVDEAHLREAGATRVVPSLGAISVELLTGMLS